METLQRGVQVSILVQLGPRQAVGCIAGMHVCGKGGSGASQSALVLGLSPLETHPDLLVYPVIQLSASSGSFPCGRVECAARWALGGNTYRSWRKGRGFTGMNCDNDVSWPSYLEMAVGGGPTHTHDGQAAGCFGEWVLQQNVRRAVSSLYADSACCSGLSHATGQARSLLHGQRNFGRAGIWFPRGWRLNDGYPCSPQCTYIGT